jgi:hypothetical protein
LIKVRLDSTFVVPGFAFLSALSAILSYLALNKMLVAGLSRRLREIGAFRNLGPAIEVFPQGC